MAVTNTQATAPPAEPEGDPTRSPAHGWIVAAWIAIGVAVAIGVVLRFWTQSHLWLDEALSVNIAKLPVGDIPEALRHDGHPPLYYWLLHGWMAVFGESDRSVRALSGIFCGPRAAAHVARGEAGRGKEGRVARARPPRV